ncbi:MAG TPA: poly-beta-1,6 N-acetyl-D-glucosamine export porin PgaA [Azospira sp.]|nr:poly-beta-1,6 N-acetyl-D-glucosamine export porin PgaA [Azospira sp.]
MTHVAAAGEQNSLGTEWRQESPPPIEAEGVRHARALAASREGRPLEAMALLETLRREHPDNLKYTADFITIAAWANQNQQAVAVGLDLSPASLPSYALSALAKAFRNVKAYDKALECYEILAHRQPQDLDPALGKIHTLIDAGQGRNAVQSARKLLGQAPDHEGAIAALMRADEQAGNWIEALEDSEVILKRHPKNPAASRLRFLALWRLGAPHEAARRQPADLERQESAALAHDQLAFAVRWSRIAAEEGSTSQRWQGLDQAIQGLDGLANQLEAEGIDNVARRVRADEVTALADRLRMADSIATYRKLTGQGEAPPPLHARLAVASAYLHQENPEAARELLATALANEPNGNFSSRLDFFYALLESERYDEALAYIDAQVQPEWLQGDNLQLRRPNPDYPRLMVARALARSYTERLAEGQGRLEALKSLAPASTDIGNSLAATYQMRGWPRRAEADYEWLLGGNPDYPWARLGLYNSRLAVADYQQAEQDLNATEAALPGEKAAQRARRDWETHRLHELRLEAMFGNSSGSTNSPLGTRDSSIDAWLYSQPIAYQWRLFGHTHYSTASFPDAAPVRTAAGGGLEYRSRQWQASGEAYALRGDGAALAASAAYLPDDHWRFDGGYSNKALDAPLRAYQAGVNASRTNLGATYRWHESRSTSLSWEQRDFSDDNRRQSWSAAWTERVVTGPRYKLDLRGDYYTSSNSKEAAAVNYFNPSRDRSLSLTFGNEWVQFHRYDRSLKHRLDLGVGNYWQENYGTGPLHLVRYEMIYAPDDRTELRAGISYSRRPYDGEQTTLQALTLTANWRF